MAEIETPNLPKLLMGPLISVPEVSRVREYHLPVVTRRGQTQTM